MQEKISVYQSVVSWMTFYELVICQGKPFILHCREGGWKVAYTSTHKHHRGEHTIFYIHYMLISCAQHVSHYFQTEVNFCLIHFIQLAENTHPLCQPHRPLVCSCHVQLPYHHSSVTRCWPSKENTHTHNQ